MNKLLLKIIILLFILVYIYYNQIKIILLNLLTILRGIITINCKWWNISDKIMDDSSGINLYNYYKNKKDFAVTYMFGEKIYLVTNNKYQKIILDNSPNIFNVGKLKYKFFKSFMAKNVGVSSGCPWKYRRNLNEKILDTGTT